MERLGIFGLGKQGQQVARFGRAFGMNVIAWSHNLTEKFALSIKFHGLLLMICLKCLMYFNSYKIIRRTMGFVDINKIKLMKKSAIIINIVGANY